MARAYGGETPIVRLACYGCETPIVKLASCGGETPIVKLASCGGEIPIVKFACYGCETPITLLSVLRFYQIIRGISRVKEADSVKIRTIEHTTSYVDPPLLNFNSNSFTRR